MTRQEQAEFAKAHALSINTVRGHFRRGCCSWPRRYYTRSRSQEPIRGTYKGMMARCYAPASTSYGYCGGRGIKVCSAWVISFEQFIKDIEALGPRPSSAHTLDRINNDGNYEPGNVRWADKQTQKRNQRPRKDSGRFPGLVWRRDTKTWRYRWTDLDGIRHTQAYLCPVLHILAQHQLNKGV